MKLQRTQKLTDFPHLNLYQTQYEDRLGQSKSWVFASRQDPPRIVSKQWDTPDAVVIVPYHVSRHKLVIIQEYRVALGGYQYGFPAGLVDTGESVDEACRRELHEETGLALQRIIKQSPPVYSSSGMTDESVAMVFVECDGSPTNAANESSEDIQAVFVGPEEAGEICAQMIQPIDAKAWIVLEAFAQTGTL